jgi:hypothetical protein
MQRQIIIGEYGDEDFSPPYRKFREQLDIMHELMLSTSVNIQKRDKIYHRFREKLQGCLGDIEAIRRISWNRREAIELIKLFKEKII